MTKHDFIFSNERRHRIARHITFWLVWLLFYLLLFHYPIHSFKGWNISDSSGTFQKIGLVKFIVKTLVFNAFLAVVVPHALFIYLLLYWLLPRFYYQKRNPFIVAGVTFGLLFVSVFVFAAFRIMVNIGNILFSNLKHITFNLNYTTTTYPVIREMLTSFPVVLGFALLIKLMKRWWLKQVETTQLMKEKTKAELQLLKAQVHPHFLFNTLNNIYYFTLKGSPKAPEMISKLSALLHYIINECNQPLVPLEKEIAMLEDYMALEKIRYGEQMQMNIDVQGESSGKYIAPLLLIPFVENSFKHGASKMLEHPWVKLSIIIEENRMFFYIGNSRPLEAQPHLKKGNIGLKNVKQRLQLLYPQSHELNIVSEPESFTASLTIQLQEWLQDNIIYEEPITTNAYAMA